MITEYYKNLKYFSQEIICKTELFDKEYFYMRDIDGTVYLCQIDDEGQPKFA